MTRLSRIFEFRGTPLKVISFHLIRFRRFASPLLHVGAIPFSMNYVKESIRVTVTSPVCAKGSDADGFGGIRQISEAMIQ
jgi:hypothetical protein